MHSFRSVVVAGLLGVAVTGFSAPGAGSVDRTSSAAVGRVCGADRTSGLGVWAGPATSCPTALQVASGYTRLARHAGGSAVTVRAGGTVWTCREQQGNPNPYLKCVDTAGSRQWVELTS
ncbi:hypothetical protein ACFW1F_17025 [Streptomyces bungoensis]|uniref:hypothetical protein n=1 Tax=Streptomyces bungoensis TaxID=285568 RepID=UPI0036C78397